jgi:hypothetical protein
VLVRLADVDARQRAWLWPGRLARGGLTLLAGEHGAGLEALAHDLAARVSRGAAWPDRPTEMNTPAAVVLVSGDDLASGLRPRLDAAGAEAQRICVLRAARCAGAEAVFERPISPWRDLALVENAVAQTHECTLMMIAAPMTGPGGDRPPTTRELEDLLLGVAGLAARQRVAAVVAAEGLTGQTDTLRRLSRSGAAAAVLAAIRDEVRPGRELLVPMSSWPGCDDKALAFTVASGRVEWEAASAAVTKDDVLDRLLGRTARTERREAAGWLLDVLAYGPIESKALFQQARECGIGEKTLRRTAADLRLRPTKQTFDGPWLWRLETSRSRADP